jgi:hydroxymethylbilane synthase
VDGRRFVLTGLVAEIDGSALIRHRLSGPVQDAGALGVELAEVLLTRGADIILNKHTSTAL